MNESEKKTRERRIDLRLKSTKPQSWTIIAWKAGMDTTTLDAHAVTEYPTKSGPVDYALFVKGMLLGMIEAKKVTVGVENVLEQAKRYAKAVENTIGDWRGYRVPFLYSTNGELIYHLDTRKKKNISHQVSDFPSPYALLDRFNRDTESAEQWFKSNPVNSINRLRYYQVEAVENIEKALCEGRQQMLLTMATGTGKTFTIVSLVYRLMKSGYARRILFLVDRRALAAQAVAEIAAFQTPEGLKLDKTYEVYSQRFRREDLDENMRFDVSVLPEDYLTNPSEKHSYIYISTIQRMVINLLGREGCDHDNYEYDSDAGILDIPIHAFDVIIADECHRGYTSQETGKWRQVLEYFDAIKIGLTATPAAHTMGMFNHIVYSYCTDRAVEDGYLADYDAIQINSGVKVNGAFLDEGDKVGDIDTDTGKETLVYLEDEREFNANEIEVKITAPDSTQKIIQSLKKYTGIHQEEYGRFPKTLIFAVNDQHHTSHADEVVKTCKQVFNQGDDFVLKITGKVDRPLQKIRQFRNRPEPRIVVTVDMLSTGVDIPAIEFIVFMRMVKSRILWVQMKGRGTRLCDEINKEKFTIFDCFSGTLIDYFKDSTEMDSRLMRETLQIEDVIERIYDNRDRDYHTKVLIKRLRRIEKNMGAPAREQFEQFIENGDIKQFTDHLRENLENNFTEIMKLLRNKEFQHLLVNYTRPKRVFYRGYDIVDTVDDEVMFPAQDTYQKPEDYLKSFERFVRENPDKITALEILLNRPREWSTAALEELRNKLKRSSFRERDLQKAHRYVYQKPLADIISMIKHAADFQVPILDAVQRVNQAMASFTKGKQFTEEQIKWLDYIREHLVQNLALAEEDFEAMPVFERHGGLGKARQVFGEELPVLIRGLNSAVAA